jgi:hypothetical protein
MSDAAALLSEIDKVLDELILLAQSLRDLSEQTCIEAEIVANQAKQKQLIDKLVSLEKKYQKEKMANNGSEELHKAIQQKLSRFQTLNNEFFENMIESEKGLFHFDTERQGE